MTNKEAISNLNQIIYGIVSPDIQRSLDVAIRSIRIVELIEDTFKQDSNLMIDVDDWKEIKEHIDNDKH